MTRQIRQGPMLGKPAIDFELPDLHGNTYHLGEFRSHWLLLVFHRHLG